MSEHLDENDVAPDWYVDHFKGFGYTVESLRRTWAGMSAATRAEYAANLRTPPETTTP